jgi:class 3 adenylate cyclase
VGLEIRVGLHTGEIEQRGDDIAGLAVHIAARVCSATPPGEIWVSRTITDLVAGSGVEFEDRGEHDLTGIPGPWQLCALTTS